MLNTKKKILLVGGGGHCKSVIDVIEQEGKFEIVGIIDKQELINTEVLAYKVIASDDDLKSLSKTYQYALVTVGQVSSNVLRVKLYENLKSLGFILPVIISPLAYVSRHTSIGEGTVIMHHALLNANVSVAKNCIVNSKALLEHDVVVEEHCHISTASIVNGGVLVKANTFVGSNSTSRESIELNGFIKAGSVSI